MLEYVTNEEYIELTGAESVPNNFKQLCYEASNYINNKTFGRINTPSDNVKYVTCLLIDLISEEKAKNNEVSNVKSENVDGWSRSYATATEVLTEYTAKKYDLLKTYLLNEFNEYGVPLLYIGGI